MRLAIQTKYIAPTNHRDGRIKAKSDAGSIIVEWDHALGTQRNHLAAAKKLADKFGWKGVWSGGAIDYGYVFVQASEDDFII